MGARWSSAAIAMVIASCQTVGPTPSEPPTTEPRPRGPEAPKLAATPSGPEAAPHRDATPSDHDGVPRPPPLQTLQAMPHGFDPEAIVLDPPSDERPVVLFADERAKLRRSVAASMLRGGASLVPVDELERIEAAAATGRLVLEGDLQCRAPLSPTDVLVRYFPAQRRAMVQAQCWDDCLVEVLVWDLANPEGSETWTSGPVRRPHDPASWTSVRVKRDVARIGLGAFVTGGMSHPPPIRFDMIESIGPWRTAPTGERLHALEPEVARCAHPDRRIRLQHDVRLSVGADGAVTRCTADSAHSQARPEDERCLCEVIEEKLHHRAGRAGRRLRALAIDDGDFFLHGIELRALQPGTEVWLDRVREHPWLLTCFADERPAAGLTVTVVLSLRPDGTVTDGRVFGDITSPAAVTMASCLVREAPTLALPCAPPGIDQLQIELAITN